MSDQNESFLTGEPAVPEIAPPEEQLELYAGLVGDILGHQAKEASTDPPTYGTAELVDDWLQRHGPALPPDRERQLIDQKVA